MHIYIYIKLFLLFSFLLAIVKLTVKLKPCSTFCERFQYEREYRFIKFTLFSILLFKAKYSLDAESS